MYKIIKEIRIKFIIFTFRPDRYLFMETYEVAKNTITHRQVKKNVTKWGLFMMGKMLGA